MGNYLKEETRRNYTTLSGNASLDELKVGCLMRIADAVELLAKNHAKLIEERDDYKRWYNERRDMHRTERRRVAALRGVIKRMKAGKS